MKTDLESTDTTDSYPNGTLNHDPKIIVFQKLGLNGKSSSSNDQSKNESCCGIYPNRFPYATGTFLI